jgi:DNA-binding Lrp family transcriptional regulator
MIDEKIVELLQENARIAIKEIAAQVFLSSPAVTARIERLESKGIIKGYHATVDSVNLGYKIKAFVNLDLEPVQKEEFYPFIESVETLQVLYCFRCPDCGLDQVLDGVMEEFWTLTDADYGPDGFHDRREIQDTLF